MFDLDGTLLRGDTVCIALARQLDRLARMQELETVRDLEAISSAREEMALWYATATESQRLAAYRSLLFAPGVQEGFRLLRENGIATAIISLTWEFAVEWCATELAADYFAGTRLNTDGTVAHLWPTDKADWVVRLCGKLGLKREEVAAVGDSWGDAELLAAVAYPFFVGTQLPPGILAKHYPDGDIARIARRIIGN